VAGLKRLRGQGHAKLLLFGEHAAVHGHPAVGLSLAGTTVADLALGERRGWRFPGLDPEAGGADAALLSRMLSRLHELALGNGPGGGEARFTSDIPRGLGFGSSAALCAAAASALASGAAANAPTTGQVWAWAHEAERLFHGTPSGIDTGLALLDGLYLFQPAPPGLPEPRRLAGLPLDLVVGAVPRRRDTAALVRSLRERLASGDRRANEALRELGELARRAADLLDGPAERQARLEGLGELANAAQRLLAGQELSTPELDGLLREGLACGAIGAKLSGAGGGGAFFLICLSTEDAERIAERLRAAARRADLPTAGTIRALRYWPAATAAPQQTTGY
jgi:mevalonate kinase